MQSSYNPFHFRQVETMPTKLNNKVKIYEKQRATLVQDPEVSPSQASLVRNSEPEDSLEAKTKETKSKKVNKKAFFALSNAKPTDAKIQDDFDLLMSDKVDVKASPHLGFFSNSPQDFASLLEMEENEKSDDAFLSLRHWSSFARQDLKSVLEEQVEHLHDFHIALASAYDHQTWKWACGTFAKQLEEKNPVKSSAYYLMINQVDKAISTLVNANFFQAAITIARARLPSDHPLISDLFRKWAIQASTDGTYELAAKCWFAIQDYAQAGHSLSKSSDGNALRVASQMFLKVSGETERAKVLGLQAVEILDKTNDVEGLHKIKQEIDIQEVQDRVQQILLQQ